MDSFGDHLLCCNKAEFYSRHQAVVKILTAFLAAAGLRVANEVQIDGRQRPANIFVDRWTTADPAAIDVTVTHALAPSLGLNVRSAKGVAAMKEQLKTKKYSRFIRDKHLQFIPAAFTGALGPEATGFVDSAADFTRLSSRWTGVSVECSSCRKCKWRCCRRWASGYWRASKREAGGQHDRFHSTAARG